jgi:hypothetical protein
VLTYSELVALEDGKVDKEAMANSRQPKAARPRFAGAHKTRGQRT